MCPFITVLRRALWDAGLSRAAAHLQYGALLALQVELAQLWRMVDGDRLLHAHLGALLQALLHVIVVAAKHCRYGQPVRTQGPQCPAWMTGVSFAYRLALRYQETGHTMRGRLAHRQALKTMPTFSSSVCHTKRCGNTSKPHATNKIWKSVR